MKRVAFSGLSVCMGLTLAAPAWSQDKPGDKPADKPDTKMNGATTTGGVKESITNRGVDDLVKDLSGKEEDRTIAESELPRRGKLATAPLLNCLTSPTGSVEARLAAVRCIRKLRPTEAPPHLLAVYKDVHAPLELRAEVARTLGDFKAADAIPVLIEGLADNMFKVSETARAALRDMGQLAIDPLVTSYRKELTAKDGRDGVIFRSILLMGEIPCDKSRAVLLEALKTREGPRAIGIRHHAAIALGLLQDKLAIEPLIDAYEQEREFRVAMAIDRSLAWLTNEQNVPPQAYRWKAWWAANRDKFFPKAKDKEDDIFIPKGGVPKDEKK